MTAESQKPYQALKLVEEGSLFAFLVNSFSSETFCSIPYNILYGVMLGNEPGVPVPVVNIRTRIAQIRVHGRNLPQLVRAFSSPRCVCITEFNPALHKLPADETALVLERIEVFVHHQYN